MPSAAKKITELTAASAVVGTDLMPVVQDLGTTPITKKATFDIVATWLANHTTLLNKFVSLPHASRVDGEVPVWNATTQLWVSGPGGSGGGGGSPTEAVNVSIADAGGFFTATTVEGALQELDPGQFSKTTRGRADKVFERTGTGTVSLDLTEGNLCRVTSTTGNYTFATPTGVTAGRAIYFDLTILTSVANHTPAWWAGITWMSQTGAPVITWSANSLHSFSFLSPDGGTTWLGWHTSPTVEPDAVAGTVGGVLTTFTDTSEKAARLRNRTGRTRTIISISIEVVGAPTGSAIWVDFHKGSGTAGAAGVSIFNTGTPGTAGARMEIPANGYVTEVTSFADATWNDDEWLAINIDQVGSTAAGTTLTYVITYRQGA